MTAAPRTWPLGFRRLPPAHCRKPAMIIPPASTTLAAVRVPDRRHQLPRLLLGVAGAPIGDRDFCAEDLELSSACLRAMVEDYFHCSEDASPSADYDPGSAAACARIDLSKAVLELDSALSADGPALKQLAEHVNCALSSDADRFSTSAEHLQRLKLQLLLKKLKTLGYNAGICKTMKSSRRAVTHSTAHPFPQDEHVYIDVLLGDTHSNSSRIFCNDIMAKKETCIHDNPKNRVFIEVQFREQFRVARPCAHYKELLEMVPEVFVGSAHALQRIVRLMAQGAKASLESQGLMVPPWRRPSFMLAKWLSPCYSRSTTIPHEPMYLTSKRLDHGHVYNSRVLKELNNSSTNNNIGPSLHRGLLGGC